ncbi:MAG: type II secretion system F family protein [Acidimicrobiales bacterium]|nr:type II secretion system F family protein [Acidimicrobiales bacterium]
MRPATRLRLAALAGVVGLLALVGPAAVAQSTGGADGEPFLAVRSVDSQYARGTALGVTWTGDAADLEGLRVTENGEEVRLGAPLENTDPKGVVFVVESSSAMDTALAGVKDAVTALAADLPSGTEMALVSYADSAQLVRDFTTDPQAIADGVDGLVADGATAMWDGVYAGAQALEDAPDLQPNMVVISASPDSASVTSPTRVTGLATSLGTSVLAVGIEPGAPASALDQLVSTTGGRYLATADVDRTLKREVRPTLVGQYDLIFATQEKSGAVVDLGVELGDLTTAVSYVDGADVAGNLALAPVAVDSGGGGLLQSGVAKLLAVVFALVAVTLGVYAIVLVFTKDEDGLSAVLQVYSDPYGAEADPEDADGSAATSALIQRAVDLTEEFAERQGVLAKTEGALERAAMPLRAAEALFFYGAFTLAAFVLLFLLTGNLMATAVVGIVLAAIPPMVVSFKAKKRQKEFLAQLPDTLALLAGTLRAGYSLMQGVEAVSQEVEDPMGLELRRVVTEARLGRPLEESLDGMAERMDSPDFAWAVMAIRIQREVGGNLSELLLTVAETMTARERLRREVAALTAEGRVSAYVLAGLPVALGLVMYTINPKYTGTLFSETLGIVLLVLAAIGMLVGFLWMRKIINIEI